MLAVLASHLDSIADVGGAAEVQANAAPGVSAAALATTSSNAVADYEPSDILVRFRTDLAAAAADGMPLATTSESLPLVTGLTELHLASGVSVDDALATYRARPDVLYAEPNYRIHTDAIPNDTQFGQLWGLNNTGQSSGTADDDIDAAEAWNISTGSSTIVVGVIDSGVDYTHPDLAANIWTNPGEIPGNGIDDDGDGFIDDVHGYNFVANNGNPMDDLGHGTHVSGTIGAIGNNGVGVAGVNWNVQIMAIKFLDSSGSGTDSAAIAAINYAALMHSRGVNIKLTSNSWGGGGFSQALQDAIAATQQQGMLFIAAAGNSNFNTDTTPNYPSGYPLDNIISVAASDRNDAKASFSNYGATTVDLTAPGVDVLSTTPNNTYSVYSGTSMATPHVAGVAALAWSVAPNATYQQIRNAILAGVDPNNAFRVGGPTPVATGGRLNALGTLQHLGLIVSASAPAAGSTVAIPPTSFAISFSAAVDPTSVDASDFTVDGIAAGNVALDASHTTATFTYATTPVAVQGQHTMHIAAGSIVREGNPAQTIVDFNGTLRYDAVPLQVVATLPPAGGGFALPGPLTYDVNFNEAVDPASVQAGDLALAGISGAAVSGVTVVNNNTTARFTLSGIALEGTLTATIAAGAISDSFGNPNSSPFSFTYSVDNGVVAFPTPLSAELPLGSLIYDRSTTGTIGPAGDTDGFTLQLDAEQTLSIVVTPTVNTLQPAVELRDSTGALITTVTASAGGKRAVIETTPISAGGLYTVNVSGASGTSGGYLLKVTLNAAEELEVQATPPNDTQATAQNIDSSFVALATVSGAGQRGAVVGGDGGAAGAFSLANFENGTGGYVINNNSVPGNAAGWWHLSTRRGSEAGHSSTTSFYYGNETTGNYDTPGQANAGNITSSQITLAAATSVTLSFSYVLLNESPSWDVASVMVSSNGGSSFTTIASSTSTTQLPATSTWKAASFDLSAYAGQTILLRFNFDTIDSIGNAFEGWYVDDVQLSSPTKWTDYYSFTAAANDTASLELKNLSGSGAQIFVEDASGQALAIGGSKTNVDAAINDLLLAAAGTYYVRVTGTGAVAYDLVVTKDAEFNIEANNTTTQAQDIFSGLTGLWQYAVGHVGASGDSADVYRINLPTGGTVSAQTFTPADGSGQFVNSLDPRLRILDSSGAAVATDENGAADGRNAVASYTNSGAAASFYVEVAPTALVAATSGEYVLRVSGNAVLLPLFQVAATNPASGASVGTAPASMSVDFNDSLLASSVQASDLLIDGLPMATGVTIVDGDSVRFSLPSLATGQHVFALSAGSVQDVQGTPLVEFSGTLTVDTSAPRVIATSVAAGGTVAPGALAYQITFSKAMQTANLSADDFSLKGTSLNTVYTPSSYSFDASGTVLTLNFTNVPEDYYSLTLVSGLTGGTNFTDPVGNALDGEFNGTLPSGDGFSGGNFVIGFDVDAAGAIAFPATGSKGPFGSLIYTASVSAAIGHSGDTDSFMVSLDAGQTITIQLSALGNLDSNAVQGSIELRDPNNVLLGSTSTATAGATILLQTIPVVTAGTYTINVSSANGSRGAYTVFAVLNAALELESSGGGSNDSLATAQNIASSFINLPGLPATVTRGAVLGTSGVQTGNDDYYAVPLTAGDRASFVFNFVGGGTFNIELRDAANTLLATGVIDSVGVNKAISNFTAPTTDTYYLRVTAIVNTVYTVVVTKNAAFDTEANDSFAAAQWIGGNQSVLGYGGTGATEDWYLVPANGLGGMLGISTATPSDGPNQFANTLNPHVELYDPNNVKIATGTPLADGRNETIQYQPLIAGNYRLRVTTEGSTSGEYAVRIDGSSPNLLPFQVSTTTPANGAKLTIAPTSVTVDFNRAYLTTSVQAGDLLIDGTPIATAATFVDGDTVSFALPAVTQGTHTVSLAAGAIQDLSGTALSAFSGTFAIDTVAPKVNATSIAPGGTVSAGAVSYQVTFSEPMKVANLSSDDFTLKGNNLNVTYLASNFSFDSGGTVLMLNYANLPEDAYTLTLVAGSTSGANFTDLAGLALDGEFGGTFPSGNGSAGGNFIVTFNADAATVAFPTLTAKQPLGSLIYDGSAVASISPAGDSDSFSLSIDSGQTISVLVLPQSGGLVPAVELRDPAGVLLGSNSSASPAPVVLQTMAAVGGGTYKIIVTGANNTTGSYKVAVTLNAALEAESNGGATNDTLATAQNIDASAVALGANSARLAVLGSIGAGPSAGGEDFEAGVLPASFTTYSSNSFGRILITAPGGTGNTSKFALLMDSNTDNNYALNEAVYHVNLVGMTQATLSFSHYQSTDEADALPADFQGHANGDGVAISDDGTHWHTILNAPTNTSWTTATVDLAAAAAAAGMKLGTNFQIKFQQYDNFTYPTDGRAYDNIQIQLPDPQDIYQLTLAAGDQLSVVAKSLAGGSPSVQLLSAGGALLSSSLSGPTNVNVALSNFVAPTSGSYYLTVSGATGTSYSLVATRNAIFDLEANDTSVAAQSLGASPSVLGYLASGNEDWYLIGADGAGGMLNISTATPSDGPNQFANTLNAHLELYNPANVKVATGTPLADGRNESIQYQPLVAGSYRLRVTSEGATSGEYSVRIDGSAPATSPFQVSTTTPASGTSSNTPPTSFIVNFNRAYLATSVLLADLLIDGVPSATAVTFVDGDTVSFGLPALGQGTHTFSLPAGTLQDLAGTALATFSGTITLDVLSPTVIATSPAPGGTASPGALSYQVTFSEAMKASNLSSDDFSLVSNTLSTTYAVTSSSFNAAGTVLTLNYSNLPEDSYTLTLVAGATNGTNFTDAGGNALDGEFSGTLPSGNGTAGGNFVVTFNLDAATVAFPTPLAAKQPPGSLIYDGTTTGVIAPAADSDSFLLSVNAGQTISVLVSPQSGGLAPAVELRDPAGILLASGSSATSVGTILQAVPATSGGTYKITVSGANNTTGSYKMTVTLNAALEAESNGGATNDTLATAQNIDASAVALSANSTRLAVVGSIGAGPAAGGEDFEGGVLPASFTTYSSNSFGRIRVIAPGGSGNASKFALLMDSNTDNNYALNEAVYHVNLTGVTQATLSFMHFQSTDEADALPADFQGHANGDGVAISDDGTHWHTILNAPTNTSWTTATTDLAAAAAAAGMKLGANFQIKFQQYDNYTYTTDGRAYDSIQIQLPDPQDTYQLTLAAGDSFSAAVKAITGSAASFQLLDSSGAVLGSGATGPTNVDKALPSFVVPVSGSYYLAVTGAAGSVYSVLAMRNATFDSEANDTFATAQSFNETATVLGAVSVTTPTPQEDWYSINVPAAGAFLSFQTATPGDGGYQFVNTLNPHIELYDPSDALVASGAVLPDGRNESVQYQTLSAGGYRVRVTAESGTSGEYVLSRPPVASFSVDNLAATSPIVEGDATTLSGSFDDA
ncbi:MAG TPA: S8 family serine peptidase, partial [Pirellulaceae bacterium]